MHHQNTAFLITSAETHSEKQLLFGVAFLSGIAAILTLDGSAVPQYEVERMANALKPYGPYRQKILVRGAAAFIFCLDNLVPEDIHERQPLVPLVLRAALVDEDDARIEESLLAGHPRERRVGDPMRDAVRARGVGGVLLARDLLAGGCVP